uniref:Uncharacterized protein n=1 Tax=Eutreptiella gymnastica TaxID=73025 RepID=A0A7S4G3H0_9EUGL|mmetsp:Transcript_18538/g.32196  ORF Transcript_18538/g.32196 Transcript_18538/m.32196 type:complete len:139 (+) Transcript_18538:239-655(+)
MRAVQLLHVSACGCCFYRLKGELAQKFVSAQVIPDNQCCTYSKVICVVVFNRTAYDGILHFVSEQVATNLRWSSLLSSFLIFLVQLELVSDSGFFFFFLHFLAAVPHTLSDDAAAPTCLIATAFCGGQKYILLAPDPL